MSRPQPVLRISQFGTTCSGGSPGTIVQMGRIRTRRAPLVAGLLALAAAGCGTTVSGTASTVADGGQGGQALTGPGTAAGGSAGSVGGTGTAGGSSVLGGGSGSTSSGAAASSAGATYGSGSVVSPPPGTGGGVSTSGSAAANGPGITPSTIYIADAYEPDAAAADSALGAANANPGDTKTETEAIVKYINNHGGVAGRKLSVVWYKASVYQDANTTYQQACSTWTQDNKVFVIGAGNPILDQCIANAHAVGITSGAITLETTAMNQKYPADINVSGLTNDRAMKLTIEGLAKQGYFANGAKVGIATWDSAYFSWSIQHAAVPALNALGVHNVPVEYITPPQSYGELGATSASTSSAVLKFRQMGIDHVILFDGAVGVNASGVLVLEWMQQAQSQHYNPRYGLDSTSGFTSLASDYPKQQMVGSIGVGWDPSLDVPASDWPPSKLPPSGRLCLQIMRQAGQPASGANAAGLQLAYCDRYFFIKRVLDAIRGPINQQSAMAVIDAIGSGYQPLTTFGISLSPQQHDGVRLVRNVGFDASCTCYHYTSQPYSPGG